MSVSETTPAKRPEMRAPGREAAEMDGPVGAMKGSLGEESTTAPGEVEKGSEDGVLAAMGGVPTMYPPLPLCWEKLEEWLDVGTRVAECRDGVGGPDEDGDAAGSVIHILCDFVATSLATVWASVEKGVT